MANRELTKLESNIAVIEQTLRAIIEMDPTVTEIHAESPSNRVPPQQPNQEHDVCYYGLRVGCPNATLPDCRTCADRLTRAVDRLAGSMAANDGEADQSGSTALGDDASEHSSYLSDTLISYSKERS